MKEFPTDRLHRTESLRDRALEVLRQAIVSGQVHPGELYSASALARRLGVSVSPVREAMLTLANEGIMEPVRNRGFRLTELTEQDLAEVFELRLLLEVPAVVNLAGTDLSAHMAALGEKVEAIERAAAAGDVNTFLARDRDFHLALLELNGNRRLVDQVAVLRDQTRLYGMAELADKGMLDEAAAEHRTLLAALAAGDAELLRRLMTEHLQHIRHEWATGEHTGAGGGTAEPAGTAGTRGAASPAGTAGTAGAARESG
ncbi:MAG TPA: GntR family transcriptional regulator [Streptomyces sp.]|nr:GntR family transcriptional regulator [Streptomyces sp.]